MSSLISLQVFHHPAAPRSHSTSTTSNQYHPPGIAQRDHCPARSEVARSFTIKIYFYFPDTAQGVQTILTKFVDIKIYKN